MSSACLSHCLLAVLSSLFVALSSSWSCFIARSRQSGSGEYCLRFGERPLDDSRVLSCRLSCHSVPPPFRDARSVPKRILAEQRWRRRRRHGRRGKPRQAKGTVCSGVASERGRWLGGVSKVPRRELLRRYALGVLLRLLLMPGRGVPGRGGVGGHENIHCRVSRRRRPRGIVARGARSAAVVVRHVGDRRW